MLAALTAGLGLVVWMAAPSRVALDLPVRPHLGGGAFWHEDADSTLSFSDSAGVRYLRRRVGTAYPDTQGWRTEAEALDALERLILPQGWLRVEPAVSTAALPESRFLRGEQMRRYVRSRGARSRPEEEVMVAAWPIGGAVEGLHVVVVTSAPSFRARLAAAFD